MNHPITPSLALIDRWWYEAKQNAKYDEPIGPLVATRAAQWGANQELKACCEWLEAYDYDEVGKQLAELLRAVRRPKPPSLKEQALALLQPGEPRLFNSEMQDTIRRALEALPND